jgi:NAD(P)-dependent dehydrogenase (short-subunit alcohol dehydrogenase family)
MIMSKLEGKIALITGGTTGIGAATAKLFHAQGATVIVTGSKRESVEAAWAAMPGVEAILCDQSDVAATQAMFDRIKTVYERIDVLVANAGTARFMPMEAVDEAFFDTVININVRGTYFVVKHAAALMPEGGAIVLMSSTVASQGMATASVYAASKAAIRSLGRTFAAELAPRGIRVNTVSPGPIRTPMYSKNGMTPADVDAYADSLKSVIPLQRIGEPEDVAAAVLFLAADAGFVTGEELIVGGGLVSV